MGENKNWTTVDFKPGLPLVETTVMSASHTLEPVEQEEDTK